MLLLIPLSHTSPMIDHPFPFPNHNMQQHILQIQKDSPELLLSVSCPAPLPAEHSHVLGRPHFCFPLPPSITQFTTGNASLGPCGPGEVTVEMVTSLLQKDLKGVVGRAGRVKEVQCLDLSPCWRNKQSLSGTICEQAHCCPGMGGGTCSSSLYSGAARAALVPLLPSISQGYWW